MFPLLISRFFLGDDFATAYYLPGTTGWDATIGGIPTAYWQLPNPVILQTDSRFGVLDNHFGFIISWATNDFVVVEARTTLDNSCWTLIATNTLVNGSTYFYDCNRTNYPARFYRLRSR